MHGFPTTSVKCQTSWISATVLPLSRKKRRICWCLLYETSSEMEVQPRKLYFLQNIPRVYRYLCWINNRAGQWGCAVCPVQRWQWTRLPALYSLHGRRYKGLHSRVFYQSHWCCSYSGCDNSLRVRIGCTRHSPNFHWGPLGTRLHNIMRALTQTKRSVNRSRKQPLTTSHNWRLPRGVSIVP